MESKIHDDYPYNKKELKRFLVAFTCEYDELIMKKGGDPNNLRAKLYEISGKDQTKPYNCTKTTYDDFRIVSHYVNDKDISYGIFPDSEIESSFTEGITLMYCNYLSKVFIINYNPDVVIGQINGVDVFGQIKCENVEGVVNDFAEDGSLMWEHTYPSLNLVDIFNIYPSIIIDLCNHDDIGPKKLLKILNIMR